MQVTKEPVFVPMKDDINSTKDDWYVLSGVPNPDGGAILEQKKFGAALSASQAEAFSVMARLAVNWYKELNGIE
jgi:hypothetical protein